MAEAELKEFGQLMSCVRLPSRSACNDEVIAQKAEAMSPLLLAKFATPDAALHATTAVQASEKRLFTASLCSGYNGSSLQKDDVIAAQDLNSAWQQCPPRRSLDLPSFTGLLSSASPTVSAQFNDLYPSALAPQAMHKRPSAEVPETSQHRYEFSRREAMIGGPGARSTLMVRHIPCRWTINELLAAIEPHVQDRWSLLYIPCKSLEAANAGFAFLDLQTSSDALSLYDAQHGRCWPHTSSRKVCEIRYARLQGPQLAQHLLSASADPSRATRGYLAIRTEDGRVTTRTPAPSIPQPLCPPAHSVNSTLPQADPLGCDQEAAQRQLESLPVWRQERLSWPPQWAGSIAPSRPPPPVRAFQRSVASSVPSPSAMQALRHEMSNFSLSCHSPVGSASLSTASLGASTGEPSCWRGISRSSFSGTEESFGAPHGQGLFRSPRDLSDFDAASPQHAGLGQLPPTVRYSGHCDNSRNAMWESGPAHVSLPNMP